MSLPPNTSASFYIPKPATPINAHSFTITAAEFAARFTRSHHAPTLLCGLPLLGAALDAGYGSPSDQKNLLKLPTGMRRELRAYQRARWKFLQTLLETAPLTGEVFRRDVASRIESTEKGDAAFILGCLGSRYATGEWLRHRKQTVTRFWHYSIYAHPAVSFGISDDNRRPDYLAHGIGSASTAQGHWYAVEAKGSLGDENWDRLQRGLNQARLLKRFSFGAPGAPAQSVTVSDHGVSLACFENKRLHVIHVDPPAGEGDDAGDAGAPGADDVDAFHFHGDLVEMLHAYQGYQQFHALTQPSTEAKPPAQVRDRVSWGDLIVDVAGVDGVHLAIPDFLVEKASLISDLLVALNRVAPALASAYRQAAGAADPAAALAQWGSWLQAEREAAVGSTRAMRFVRAFLTVLAPKRAAGQESAQLPAPDARGALALLVEAQVVTRQTDGNGNYRSIGEIAERLREGRHLLAALALDLQIPLRDEAVAATGAPYLTQQGLLLVSGTLPWRLFRARPPGRGKKL